MFYVLGLIATVLILGMCFFAGGLRFAEQGFDASEESSSLLNLKPFFATTFAQLRRRFIRRS